MILVFTRSGPGVWDGPDRLPEILVPDYARLSPRTKIGADDPGTTGPEIPLRRFRRVRYSVPTALVNGWEGWADTTRGPRGEWVVPVYIEETRFRENTQ